MEKFSSLAPLHSSDEREIAPTDLARYSPQRIESGGGEPSSASSEYSEVRDYAADKTFYVPDRLGLKYNCQEDTSHPNDGSPGTSDESSRSFETVFSAGLLTRPGDLQTIDAAVASSTWNGSNLANSFINASDQVQNRSVFSMSVFDCCVKFQVGFSVHKKKSFRRSGRRRVSLNAGCNQLCWTSRKRNVPLHTLDLQEVTAILCVDNKLTVSSNGRHRLSFVFADPEEARVAVRALSGLIPLQAPIKAPRNVALADYEREEYSLCDDLFNDRHLREYGAVHSCVFLCAAKGHRSNNTLLAFSITENVFYSMRFIPDRVFRIIVGSRQKLDALMRLDHPNLVKYHQCFKSKDTDGYYLVHENVAQGSLFDYHSIVQMGKVSEGAARGIVRDILKALLYLHSQQCAHGDVRPGNLLVAANGSIKLNPLGFISNETGDVDDLSGLTRTRLGGASPAFAAPELCWNSPIPSPQGEHYVMDVWSVGVVLFFIVYGRHPFAGHDERQIQNNICYDQLRFPQLPETSGQLKDLLQRVLARKEWDSRITLVEMQRHAWFKAKER